MDRYYSAHVFRWPVLMMLRCMWRVNPIITVIFWPLFLMRKLPGLKPAVTYAIRYPHQIPTIDFDTIPNHARVSLEARKRECESLGFGDAICYQPETLGAYEHYEMALFHETRQHIIQLRWFRVNNAGYKEQDCQMFCSSVLEQGGVLSSAAIPKNHDVAEMILDDVQRRVYPETTTLQDLFQFHVEGIPAHARLKTFDLASYPLFLQDRTRQLVDLMLERKLFFELTFRQVEKLRR